VGALAHYLEQQGISTTQISLIREHTAAIRPPRALWVPFEFGRPLGLPGDPDFQHRVLQAALDLLNTGDGPVLRDFPGAAPAGRGALNGAIEGWACPVTFSPPEAEATGTEKLLSAFRQEVTENRAWYDLSLEKRGYTSVAYFTPGIALELLCEFIHGEPLELPEINHSPAVAIRFAVQDLKAFYFESVMFRPDSVLPDSAEFNNWFWQQTAAGRVIKLLKETCLAADDADLRMAGSLLLVPMDQG
jgi:hypothetical protein